MGNGRKRLSNWNINSPNEGAQFQQVAHQDLSAKESEKKYAYNDNDNNYMRIIEIFMPTKTFSIPNALLSIKALF